MAKARSWEVTDALWKRVEPLVPKKSRNSKQIYRRKPGGGRKPLPQRKVFEGIVYVLRTGIQWKALPKEKFGAGSAIHRYFQQWQQKGFFESLWKKGLLEYDELQGICWEWQSGDGAMNKAPLAREAAGKNPTDRGKKRSQEKSSG